MPLARLNLTASGANQRRGNDLRWTAEEGVGEAHD